VSSAVSMSTISADMATVTQQFRHSEIIVPSESVCRLNLSSSFSIRNVAAVFVALAPLAQFFRGQTSLFS
jgi:hypothetical protein